MSSSPVAIPPASSRRRRENRSSEEAYAGPATLLTPPASPNIPAAKRQRRNKGSSEESEESVEAGLLDSKYRVGGPSLCRLPTAYEHLQPESPLVWTWTSGLEDSVKMVLTDNVVDWEVLELHSRWWIEDSKEDAELTIFVGALRHAIDNRWLQACIKIRELCASHGIPGLNVEIVDPRGQQPVLSYPLEPSHRIIPRWPHLLQRFRIALSRHDWIAIEVFRRGVANRDEDSHSQQISVEYGDQERPVTVVITVREESLADWTTAREELIQILDVNNFSQVAVEIGRGKLWRGSPIPRDVVPEVGYATLAKVGQSIGPHHSEKHPGTLGGFLKIQDPSTGNWLTFGVTCFHCVAQKDSGNPNYAKWEQRGIRPLDPTNNLMMDQPSQKDHKETLQYIENAISLIKTSDYVTTERRLNDPNDFVLPYLERNHNDDKALIQRLEQRKANAEAFFASGSQYLGGVFAASGIRQKGIAPGASASLDWALIDVAHERLSENTLPTKQDIRTSIGDCDGFTLYIPPSPNMKYTSVLQPGDFVYKVGRTTGITWGKMNGIEQSLLKSWKPDAQGNMVEVLSRDTVVVSGKPGGSHANPFGAGGDSGSFVFDRRGQLAGLYFGGNSYTGVSYYTPVQDLFEDIQQFTGATVVALP